MNSDTILEKTKQYRFIWLLTQLCKTHFWNHMVSNTIMQKAMWNHMVSFTNMQNNIIKSYEFWHIYVKHNLTSCSTTQWNHMISDSIMQKNTSICNHISSDTILQNTLRIQMISEIRAHKQRMNSYDFWHNYSKQQQQIIWCLTQYCKRKHMNRMISDTIIKTIWIHMIVDTIMQTHIWNNMMPMQWCKKQNEIIWFLLQICNTTLWNHMMSDTIMSNTIWHHANTTKQNHMIFWDNYATTHEIIWVLTQLRKTQHEISLSVTIM